MLRDFPHPPVVLPSCYFLPNVSRSFSYSQLPLSPLTASNSEISLDFANSVANTIMAVSVNNIQWRTVVNSVMKMTVPQNIGKFLTT